MWLGLGSGSGLGLGLGLVSLSLTLTLTLTNEQKLETPPDFKPPTMGMGKWLSYLRNVASLSPVPKDMKFGEVPQGVRVLGGTYAVDGDEVCLSLPVGLSYYTPETP